MYRLKWRYLKILIVEDDNMIREGISEYLSEFGYTVIQAKDGREFCQNLITI